MVSLARLDDALCAMYAAIARTTPGGWVAEDDGLLCCGSPRGNVATNMSIVTGAPRPEAVRVAADARFGERPYSVWTRAHADRRLEAALADVGYVELDRQPAMAFVRGTPAPDVRPDVVLRDVRDDAGRAACATIMARAFAVYGLPEESTAAHFATLDAVTGDDRWAVLACADGRAVAGAVAYLADGVAGIGWVGTLPEAAGRGYGGAVTAAVVREALARGANLVVLQASVMGAPLYERLGFTIETDYGVFVRMEERG